MKIIRNSFLPFGNFAAINIFGVLFVRNHIVLTPQLINHERIHTAQMKEMYYLLFYIIYLAEWIRGLFRYRGNLRKAYRNISFEKEAYEHQSDLYYLTHRRPRMRRKDAKGDRPH